MSDGANVTSIEAIQDVATALLRLREEMQEAVLLARRAALAHQQWLVDRQRCWQARVTSLAEELIEAEAALSRCRSRSGISGGDGCRTIADWADRTRRALWEAESKLRIVRHWQSVIDDHVADFERRARVLTRDLTNRVPMATNALDQLNNLLREYGGD